MADDRTTSHAKGIHFESYLEAKLDQIEADQLKDEFNIRMEAKEIEQERQGGGVRESDTVSGDAAQQNLRPPEEMARDVDRDANQTEMRADHAGATERLGETLDAQEKLEEIFKEAAEKDKAEDYMNNKLDELLENRGNNYENDLGYNNESRDYDRN